MDSIPPPAADARGRKQVRPHPDSPPHTRKSVDMFSTPVNGPIELPHDPSVHPETLDDEKIRMQLQMGSRRSSKAASKRFSIRCFLSSLKRAIIASKLISKRDTVKPQPNPGSLRLGLPRERVKVQLQAQVQRQLVVDTVAHVTTLTSATTPSAAAKSQVEVLVCSTPRVPAKTAKELPPPCINHILSYLSPEDICRVAAVNHAWAAAAESDAVWTGKLPPHHKALVAVPLSAPTMGEAENEGEEVVVMEEEEEGTGIEIRQSSKQHFIHLAEGVVIAKGQQRVSLNPCSGAFRISFSAAMTMGVFVPHDPESWTYDVAARGSPFQKIAELHPYSFYMLGGPISCQLPPGRYSVAWRLSRCQGVEQIRSNQSCASVCSSFIDASGPLGPPLNLGWQDGVLESRITGHSASGKSQQVTRMPIAASNVLQVPMWSEVVVAEIEVKAVEGQFLCPLELTVEINEVQGRSWVGRLFVDSMVLRQLE